MIHVQLRVEYELNGRDVRVVNVQVVQRKTRVNLLTLKSSRIERKTLKECFPFKNARNERT